MVWWSLHRLGTWKVRVSSPALGSKHLSSALMRESLLIASELGKKTVHAELGIHAKRSSIGCSMVWAHS